MDKNKSRIIQVLNGYRYGGAERVALSYMEAFTHLGLPNDIFAIDVHQRSGGSNARLFSGVLRQSLALLAGVLKSNCIVITHTTRSLVVCSFLRLLFPFHIKLLHVRHFPLRGIAASIIKVLSHVADRVILITPVMRKDFAERFGEKVAYINNFIIPAASDPRTDDLVMRIRDFAGGREVIGFTGAMKDGKNPQDLIHLLHRLDHSKYCVVFVGDGILLADVKALALKFKCEESIMYCGYQDNVYSLLVAMDYYFFPSWNEYEMMPMALLEAMSCNCRCFAYDMEVNKYLLPEGNIFGHDDFSGISTAISEGSISSCRNEFDFAYGVERFKMILGEL